MKKLWGMKKSGQIRLKYMTECMVTEDQRVRSKEQVWEIVMHLLLSLLYYPKGKKKVERKVKAEQKAPNPCFNAYNTLFSSVHVEMKFVRGEIMTPGLLHVMISRHAHQATKQETNKIKNREREREVQFFFFSFSLINGSVSSLPFCFILLLCYRSGQTKSTIYGR